jgi:hypothetical protein
MRWTIDGDKEALWAVVELEGRVFLEELQVLATCSNGGEGN